mgnify:CR=1 FL=1
MRALAALSLMIGLSACVAGETMMQETTRSLARTAVDGAAARYAPGVPVKPFTDCVINTASTSELLQLAQAAGSGDAQAVASRAWPVVQTVTGRPEAQQCLVQAALSGDGLLALQAAGQRGGI